MSARTATPKVLPRRRGNTLFVAGLTAGLLVMVAALAGCSSSTDEPAESSSVVGDLPETASSGERIEAALVAGEIDKPTSLLYHLWAQFGDLDLPEQYRGAPAPHDLGVLNEVRDSLETMPAEIRSQIEPFLERPSHPDSAFNARDQATDSSPGEDPQALSVRNVAQVEGPEGPQRCSQDWISEAVPDQPFRVWACPDGGNAAAEATIATVSTVLSERAGEMIADAPNGMGAPIPDEPNADANQPSDDKIDVYVLPQGWLAPFRDLNERRMDDSAAAITMAAAPRDDKSSSAYMLVASYLLEHPEALERTLIHEVTHVLQSAHFSGLDLSTVWAFEASAVWSEIHFGPDKAKHAYKYYLAFMQDSELSLLDAEMGHRYSSFLWFLFMQQEAGPEAIFGVWNALDSAPGGAGSDAVVAAISSQLDLETAFPEFVMRLLNADLPGDPITPRLHDIAPNLPDDVSPDLPAQQLSGDSLTLNHRGVPGLGYRYTRVTLPNPEQSGVSVRVTADLATQSGTPPSIEALVEAPGGDYARVPINPAGTDLCMASDLLLVVANPSGDINDETNGAITLTRSDGPGCDAPPPTPSGSPSESPSASPSPEVPPASPETSGGSPAAVSGDYCTDMLQFQSHIQGLLDATDLPVTAQRVGAIFALAEPHLPNVPDGGIEQVQILRSYAEQAADQPAPSATAILDNEEFQRLAKGISFLVQYCDNAD